MSAAASCLFCGIVEGTIPSETIYSNEVVIAFRDVAPQAPTHVVVIPRAHIEHAGAVTVDDAATVAAMLLAAQEVAALEGIDGPDRGFRLIMNVGPDAQNSVAHLHLHVLGGRSLTWPPG